jgi:hypothetical protein
MNYSTKSRLGNENELDVVESSGESKVCLLDSEKGATLDGYDVCVNMLTTAVAYASTWSSRPACTQLCTEAMGHGGDEGIWRKHTRGANLRRQQVRTEHGDPERDSQTLLDPEVQEVWSRQEKIHFAGRIGLDVRWRIRNVVHTFSVASVLSGLDFVRVEVKVQEVLQGLRVAKKNTSKCVYLGLGASARASRFDVHTPAEGSHLLNVNRHAMESEEMIKRILPKARCQGGTREYGTD